MEYFEVEDPSFKKSFWVWFDALPLKEKEKFWYYAADMAIIYFYNKIWKNTKYFYQVL